MNPIDQILIVYAAGVLTGIFMTLIVWHLKEIDRRARKFDDDPCDERKD